MLESIFGSHDNGFDMRMGKYLVAGEKILSFTPDTRCAIYQMRI